MEVFGCCMVCLCLLLPPIALLPCATEQAGSTRNARNTAVRPKKNTIKYSEIRPTVKSTK